MRPVTRFVPRQRAERRLGIVYGFNILDPQTMQVCVDYVGQTVQELGARERQHRGDDWSTDATEQPWSDLIVGKPFIIEQGWWTQAELDERERFHIKRLQPRYNYVHNLDNAKRIPIPVARRQREERDRARGVQPLTWGRAPRVPVRRGWSAGQRKAAVLVGLWLVLAVGVWWATGDSGVHGAAAGCGAACGVYFAVWRGRKPRRRRSGSRSRRRRR